MIPRTAMEYFKAERNKHTEPYRRFYDEAVAALEFYNAVMELNEKTWVNDWIPESQGCRTKEK